jgi:hypothetical protein
VKSTTEQGAEQMTDKVQELAKMTPVFEIRNFQTGETEWTMDSAKAEALIGMRSPGTIVIRHPDREDVRR